MSKSKKNKTKIKVAPKKRTRKPASYRSKFEAKIAKQLEDNRVVFAYESDKIPYVIPESKHIYKPDFTIGAMFVECKGLLDYDSRKKMELIKAQWPDMDIRIVFMRDQPIRKGSKKLYSQWAKENNFLYAIGAVPDEWLLLK